MIFSELEPGQSVEGELIQSYKSDKKGSKSTEQQKTQNNVILKPLDEKNKRYLQEQKLRELNRQKTSPNEKNW